MKKYFMKLHFCLFFISIFGVAAFTGSWDSNLEEFSSSVEDTNSLNIRLTNAIRSNDSDLFESVLNGGADVNAKLDTGGSLLSLSSVNLDPYYFRRLLENGADPNTFNSYSKKYIIFEVMGPDRREHLKVLLKYKPALDVTDGTNSTPLIYAAILSNYESMQLLLRHGADKTSKNRFGYSALDILNDNALRECKQSPCSELKELITKLKLNEAN